MPGDDYDELLDSLSTPTPKAPKAKPAIDYRQLYNQVGQKYGVDPDLLYNQAKHESVNFSPNFVYGPGRSPKGAAGLAQFMPDTARQYGLRVQKGQDDRFNPTKAADAHARLMKDLIDKYGDTKLALAAYNSGTNRSPEQARQAMQRIPETRNYVQKIAPQGDQYDQLLDNVGQQPSKAAPKGDEYDNLLDSIAPQKPDVARETLGMVPGMGVARQMRPTTRVAKPSAWGKGTIGQGTRQTTPADLAGTGTALASEVPEIQRGLEAGVPELALLPGPIRRAATEGVAKATSGILKTGAGIVRHFPQVSEDATIRATLPELARPISQLAERTGEAGAEMEQRANRNILAQQAVDIPAGIVGSSPAFVLQRLGLPAPMAFGIDQFLKSSGSGDEDWKRIMKETGIAAGTAGLFEVPTIKSNILGKVLQKLAIVGAPTTAIELASGQPLSKAITSGAVQTAFASAGKGREFERKPIERGMSETPTEIPERVGELPRTPSPADERTTPSVAEPAPELRHVDLQRRLDDGTFGKETQTEKEARRAQVEKLAETTQAIPATPEPAQTELIQPSEAAISPAEKPPEAATTPEGATTATRLEQTALPPRSETYYRGFNQERAQGGDQYYSDAKDVAEEFQAQRGQRGAIKEVKGSELPEKLFETTNKEELGRQLGIDRPYDPGFDVKAKAALQAQGYEGIRYSDGTFGADEVHVFGKLIPPQAETPPTEAKTTGIAHRVETEARGEEPPRGKAIGAQESVERGRQLLNEGADPQTAIDDFRKSGAISAESMALVRAKHEELARVANQAFDKGGLDSPEFKAAETARQQFYDDAVKPMQTAWSNTGRAQQGETDIDTGTFYGLYRAFKNAHTREPTPTEQATLKNLSARSAKTESDVKDLSSRLAAELDKAAGIQELPKEIQTAVKRFIDQSARETRRTGRQQTRKSLDEEAAVIKTNLAAAFQKVKSQTSVQPSGIARLDPEGEITKQLIAYAKNRAKAGVTDAAQLIDDVHSTIKDFADVTKREVAEAILGAGLPKTERTESEWAKLKTNVRQEVKDYTTKEARESLGARLQGVKAKKILPKDAAEVWKYARENYVDKGDTDFADVTQKVASDLGITPEQVRRSLATTTAAKRINDEMWKKMADRRAAKQNAESWVRQADQNVFAKRFEDLRRLFFIKATLGHGVVAPFTHAPVNVFIPSRWADFWPNFGRTYKFLVDKGGHEQAMVDLENSPNYITAKRAGLANDPRRGYDEYQSPWMAKTLGKLGISGNRAFDSLKTMRQDMFDSAWNRLSEADRNSKMAELLSQEINSSTGASKALSGQDWPSRFLGKAMFAAPLEASRWEFLIRDNARAIQAFGNWKNSTPEARYMAKRVAARNAQLVATYASLLALNQGLLTATNSDDKVNFTDPTKSDFLAFKVGGRTISPASGMLTAIRFMGTLASQAKNADLKKPSQAVEDIAKTTFKYGRSKLSPLFSTGADVALRSDYTGRPLPFSQQEGTERLPRYSWLEYILSQQTPIPIGEGVRDVYNTMREDGMSEGQTKSLLKALAKAVPVGAVAATGIRVGHSYKPNPEAEKRAARQAQRAQLIQDYKSGKVTDDDLDSLVERDVITKSDQKAITKYEGMTPAQESFARIQYPSQALDRYARMSEAQKTEVQDEMSKKAWSLIHSDALTQEEKDKYKERLDELGITPTNPQKKTSSSPFSRRFLSAP